MQLPLVSIHHETIHNVTIHHMAIHHVTIHHVTTGLIIHLTSFMVGNIPSVVVTTSATANDSFNCINSHSRWKAHSTHRITYNLSNRLQECISEFRGAENKANTVLDFLCNIFSVQVG